MVRGTAGDEYDPAASPDGGDILAKPTESDGLVLGIETSTHSVNNRLGLLEDFLLHEVIETTLHDLLELDLQGLDGTDVGSAVLLGEAVDVERALVDVGDVVILKVEDLLGVFNDGRGVGGEEELGGHGGTVLGKEGTGLRAVEERLVRGRQKVVRLLESHILRGPLGREGGVLILVLNVDKVDLHLLLSSHTDNKRRTLASGDDLVGKMHRLHEQTKSTLQLLDDRLGQLDEAEIRVLIVNVLGQLRNGLCVGLGLKLEAFALEQRLELLVVCDDAVVHDGELPIGVGPGKGKRISGAGQRGMLGETYLCGWQLTREGGPWVAHRVCAMPACESKTLDSSKLLSSTSFLSEATLPTSLTAKTSFFLSPSMARPAES